MNVSDQIKVLDHKAKLQREAKELPIPIISLANLQKEPKPVLPKGLMDQVKAAIAASNGRETWEEWGFDSTNSVLLFSGPPGTGKTTTAKFIAKLLRRSLISLTGGDIGGGDFGDSERNIKRVFKVATETRAVIFLDECDGLIWDRAKATGDSMWMVSVINCFLTEIEAFDGNIILATNHPNIVDPALFERVTFNIKFTLPDYETRLRLWAIKWPNWPLKLDKKSHELLAMSEISGRKIEKTIKEEARYAIQEGRNPTIAGLVKILKRHDAGTD